MSVPVGGRVQAEGGAYRSDEQGEGPSPERQPRPRGCPGGNTQGCFLINELRTCWVRRGLGGKKRQKERTALPAGSVPKMPTGCA